MKHRALVLQNAHGEGPGILEDCLLHRQWNRKIIQLYRGDTIPSDWKEYTLLVIMGGPMNVYEEDAYPFLKPETEVIKKALSIGQPVIGFCLGAQLMAKALNARVMKGHQKEIGWYPVHLTAHGKNDPLLTSFPDEAVVFQWHGDTFDLPAGAARIFSSSAYTNQAMRIGEINYGFQFHFEITGSMISEWIQINNKEVKELGEINRAERIMKGTDLHMPDLRSYAKSFFNKYLHMIENRYPLQERLD